MNDADFKKLELINVKCDVLIDDEEYENVFEIINLRGKNAREELEKKLKDKPLSVQCNDYLLKISDPKSKPPLSVKNNHPPAHILDLTTDEFKLWLPLFFAKAIRAYLSKNGSDDAMACLDCVLMYLHHHLPAFPKNDDHQNILLQHLYFQELAACGKPGLESLGYALRAADILKTIKNPSPRLYKKELYEFWAGLNQGIGYWHSGQRMKAALEFNAIIKEFRKAAKGVSSDDKKYWQALLYDQAVLFRAELQEDLQFSYHTIQTLQRLEDPDHPNAKREKRLIKEALAYRDMRRWEEALSKIKELMRNSEVLEDSDTTLKTIFERFDGWELGKKKSGIWSETAGLLFDFYLAKFEDQKGPKKSDIEILSAKFRELSKKLRKSKPDRVSYLQQVARYLRWLSERYKGYKGKLQRRLYKEQIDNLYSHLRSHLTKKINLGDFGRYEYNRFVDAMENFYKNFNNSSPTHQTKNDECDFLRKVTNFERKKFYLYDFKELERAQRKQVLNKGFAEDCAKPSECFVGEDYSFFKGLLYCMGNMGNVVKKNEKSDQPIEPFRKTAIDEVKELKDCDYEAIMMKENERFLEYLKYNSVHPIPKKAKCSYHFIGLQRWNSQTPTLTLSQGGGYLLYKQDYKGKVNLGIAIDPGFDFVDNLFHMGFTLKDIDFILLTHAHLDHIRDFEPIVSALLDLKKRAPQEKKVKGKIHAIMTLGVYRKLENIITNTTLREFLADTYIVDIEREINSKNKPGLPYHPIRFRNKDGAFVSILNDKDDEFQIEIIPKRAFHDDYSERSDSFGYIINVKDADCRFSFGYSGDTRWHSKKIGPQYSGCDVVCIHLGALIESEDEKNEKNKFSYYCGQHCEELIEKKWHPYLFGLLRWIKGIKTDPQNKNRLILLSEFGEELKGGIRIDLIRRLNEMFPDNIRVCLPVDIGLNVVLGRTPGDANLYPVWCPGCESFVSANDIGYRHFGYGRDEALFYFCDTCLKSKPPNILQDKMQHICELGIPLRKHDAVSNRKSSG